METDRVPDSTWKSLGIEDRRLRESRAGETRLLPSWIESASEITPSFKHVLRLPTLPNKLDKNQYQTSHVDIDTPGGPEALLSGTNCTYPVRLSSAPSPLTSFSLSLSLPIPLTEVPVQYFARSRSHRGARVRASLKISRGGTGESRANAQAGGRAKSAAAAAAAAVEVADAETFADEPSVGRINNGNPRVRRRHLRPTAGPRAPGMSHAQCNAPLAPRSRPSGNPVSSGAGSRRCPPRDFPLADFQRLFSLRHTHTHWARSGPARRAARRRAIAVMMSRAEGKRASERGVGALFALHDARPDVATGGCRCATEVLVTQSGRESRRRRVFRGLITVLGLGENDGNEQKINCNYN